MADQPTDQGDRPAGDHRPTTGDDAPVPIEEAAAQLGITVNAVRQRIKRGTIEGYRTPAGWVVVVDRPATDQPATRATDHRPTTGDQPTDPRPTPTDQAPAVDLAPLADVISTLTRENRQLAEAAAVWQVRAMQAEERLKQLTAGEGAGFSMTSDDIGAGQDAPDVASAATGATEPRAPAPDAPAPWWRFWERRRTPPA